MRTISSAETNSRRARPPTNPRQGPGSHVSDFDGGGFKIQQPSGKQLLSAKVSPPPPNLRTEIGREGVAKCVGRIRPPQPVTRTADWLPAALCAPAELAHAHPGGGCSLRCMSVSKHAIGCVKVMVDAASAGPAVEPCGSRLRDFGFVAARRRTSGVATCRLDRKPCLSLRYGDLRSELVRHLRACAELLASAPVRDPTVE